MGVVHMFLNPVPSHSITLPPSPYRRLICKWQVNTQYSEAVGKTPYELAFGQAPKCGLSALPVAASLLKVLLMSPPHSFLHPTYKQTTRVAESRHGG